MINFFAILLIFFLGILLLVFLKKSLKKFINKGNLYSVNLKNRKNYNNNNKFSPNKNSFLYHHEVKKYSVFYKKSQKNKMFSLFKGNTEDKLKALKIAEELDDKSTLPILRKGLKDIAPEVVKISALLIRRFK